MNSKNSSKPASPRKKRPIGNFWYDFVKITGAIPALLWIRPRVIHMGQKCPKGGVLISSNHPTLRDPIILLTAFPWRRLHSLATKDLYKNRMLTFMFERMHCIRVDKENFNMSTFHEVVDRLTEGKAVLIFPEGQVSRDGSQEVSTFKSGVILMAHRANAPILPVYIVRRDRWYQMQPVVIGEPFDAKAAVGPIPTMEQVDRVCAELRERELELKRFYEEKYHK